jgi:hypothetical protein
MINNLSFMIGGSCHVVDEEKFTKGNEIREIAEND